MGGGFVMVSQCVYRGGGYTACVEGKDPENFFVTVRASSHGMLSTLIYLGPIEHGCAVVNIRTCSEQLHSNAYCDL